MSARTCGDCRLLFFLQAGHGCGQTPGLPCALGYSRAMSFKTRAHRAARRRSRVAPDDRFNRKMKRMKSGWAKRPVRHSPKGDGGSVPTAAVAAVAWWTRPQPRIRLSSRRTQGPIATDWLGEAQAEQHASCATSGITRYGSRLCVPTALSRCRGLAGTTAVIFVAAAARSAQLLAPALSSSAWKASSSCGEIATLSRSPVESLPTNHLL